MRPVLLTNAQQRKTLSAIRSLGSKGVPAIAAEETKLNPSSFSKYCGLSLSYPGPKEHPAAFMDWLCNTLKKHSYSILFPMDDDVLDLIMQNRSSIDKYCDMPLPPMDSYSIVSDKGKTAIAAMETGVDCPFTIVPQSLDNIEKLVKDISFPVIIKPRKSSGSRGIRIVEKKDDFTAEYMKIHALWPFPIIQEYLKQADRYDVCLLFDSQSRLKASFVQKELRHFPVDMGPSTVQESVWFPELVDISAGFVKKLGWFGVIELEFMIDEKDGKPKLLEINPRFWNSLYLSIISGVDFPWLLYRMMTEGDNIEETFSYKVGLKCRWLLPGDIFHFIASKKRFEMNPPFFTGKKHGVYDDILSWNDPLPALGFALACGRYVFDRKMWKFMFSR